jgi:hypothetical protein
MQRCTQGNKIRGDYDRRLLVIGLPHLKVDAGFVNTCFRNAADMGLDGVKAPLVFSGASGTTAFQE